MTTASPSSWPYNSLTKAPTNLKEAIDWVLRVTGKDGKKNDKAASPPQFGCLCFLAKAVKDLLYDARSPGSPGPSPKRYWDDILLEEEITIVKPVLTDLGLLSSTSATSTTTTCAGGTEVIKALMDQLALGLQKWVGWKDGESGKDVCCLNTENGIGKKCECQGGVSGCCGSGKKCHECQTCGPSATAGATNCYQSAYCKATTQPSVPGSTTDFLWPTISSDCSKVHLLARIFLGSVCLIWSGLSQLGFLTGGSTGRWKEKALSKEADGLGSFMAAMGYDLERLNQGGQKNGDFVQKLLSGQAPDKNKGIQWKEFQGDSTSQKSVAEYYSSIYGTAQGAAKSGSKTTESICTKYPLLVLHILASGYFRAGSAGAKGVITPAKEAQPITKKEDTTSPRKPRTIREILYWLSALPYSEKYCQLVGRMQEKTDQVTNGNSEQDKDKIQFYDEKSGKTELHKDKITHYLLAACGYCPLVLIGIQGTIATSGNDSAPAQGPAENTPCDQNSKKKEEKTDCNKDNTLTKQGKVCYGGYHLDVKDFGPLHGMYANGLFGFQMDTSPAQCLDQLRVYVYHCFYQLYFLRKQCTVGVVKGETTVLGWKSCRYGHGLRGAGASNWLCQKSGGGANDCQCKKSPSPQSPLMLFLCDTVNNMHCGLTKGKSGDDRNPYPEIEEHMEDKKTVGPKHFGKPPMHCPVPMGWQAEPSGTSGNQKKENHFKDLTQTHKQAELDPPKGKYPAHCTGNTLSLLLEYYCDPEKCHGTLVVLLRLLACITPTVPRTLGDLFGFYYYIVYIGGQSGGAGQGDKSTVSGALGIYEKESKLYMLSIGGNEVVTALSQWNGSSSAGCTSGSCKKDTLRCLYGDKTANHCTPFLSPLSGQQYGQLSPLMAGTYLSWLVYLIEGFEGGLKSLKEEFQQISCTNDGCSKGGPAAGGCDDGNGCRQGTHGEKCTGGGGNGVCQCDSVVSCTGVLPVLYKYGFGYGDVSKLHSNGGVGDSNKKCHHLLDTLKKVQESGEFQKLTTSINQLIYTTRLPWIFVLTIAWLVAVLYLAFGAIWPLDWTHMRSHCRGWFRKGSLSPWEILMVGKKKGRGILEFFGGR